MDLLQNIIEALDSLTTNRLRSALTVLGIVIGVGAVIAMLAIGRGAQNTITGSINSIGTNLLFVIPGGSRDVRNPKPLTLEDATALNDPLIAPDIIDVQPLISSGANVTFERQSTTTQLSGVTAGYDMMRSLSVTEGEFLTSDQILARSAVAVLGPTTADNLFGQHEGVTGRTIRVNGQPFRVIGVLASQGGSGFQNPDDQIIVPLTTAQSRLVSRRSVRNAVDMILVQAASAEQVVAAQDQIAEVLRTRHKTPIGVDDFTVFTQQTFLDLAGTVTGVLTIFLGGIAGISLLVGGIGIMNIMLVSVTERTREIGLRKAIGARKRDIMVQFLTESLLLSLAGGVIGIALGWGLSVLVGVIARSQNANLNPAVSLDAVLLATLFSAAVGLFFGLYPAKRASDLEPVEALRYE
jgi:putative ABC transport system permease protein